ncbi:MAG: ABC transporter ATP-binding protein, partial [Lachnospiraceae bacterium]|nr:ABC transporter ATP-binding protein [Lachnospiraceae bacterium]
MIKISSVCKKYGKHTILDNISINIHPGECVGIIGANGSGKTTLLSIIAGFLKPESGSITINDKNLSFSSDVLRGYISYVPQENPLMEELSALDNLRLWYTGASLNLEEELDHGILKMLGISDFLNKRVSRLSGGMKKRLSIGIALADNPSLLIMDEPSAALDLECKKLIRDYIKNFTRNGGSVLLVSHDEPELSICDKL